MKEWLTAAEIARLTLPGLPTDLSAVIRRAKREKWPSRPREASGGGREYPVSALPVTARTAYAAKHLQVDGERLTVAPATMDLAPAATPAAAEGRDARLAILDAADRFRAAGGLGRTRADALFCEGYEAGAIEVAPWVRAAVKGLTPRSLARWRAVRAAGATARLAVDKGASRRGKGALETANGGAVKTHCLALMVKSPHLSAKHVRAVIGGTFGELVSERGELIPLPPLRTFQAALSQWKATHKVELTALTDPDGFKNKYKLSGSNALAHITAVNQLWMIDASPLDMMCVDGRHNVYVAVDVASRRMMAYVTRTPRAEGVALLMRRALLAWGVPQEVKTDNGSDFVARSIRLLFENIKVDRVTSAPFSPEEKGHVERAIKTFQHSFVTLLDGYIGHSVADRKVIEGRRAFSERLGTDDRELLQVKLTAAEVQAKADAWIRLVYEHDPHEGLGRQTPFAVAAASRDVIRTVDPQALDVLLAPLARKNGLATATKRGIRINHSYYLAPHILPGTQVLVRMDPMDLGRAILFDVSGTQHLGEAICPVLEGIDPKAAVAAAKKAQAEHIAKFTGPIRAEARKIGKGASLVDLVLRHAAQEAGKLVPLPKRTEAHTTPALEAAAQAAAPRQAPKPSVSAEVRALRAQLAAEPAAPANVRTLPESPRQRWRRADGLEQAMARGEPVSAEDAQWLMSYVQTHEYKGFQDTYRPGTAPGSAG